MLRGIHKRAAWSKKLRTAGSAAGNQPASPGLAAIRVLLLVAREAADCRLPPLFHDACSQQHRFCRDQVAAWPCYRLFKLDGPDFGPALPLENLFYSSQEWDVACGQEWHVD